MIPMNKRAKRAQTEGMIAFDQNKTLNDNPYLSLGGKGKTYSCWWDKGFIEKQAKLTH